MPSPSSFASVPLNTRQESSCSPVVDEDFRGLVITTPDEVALAERRVEEPGDDEPRPVLPVCMTLQYSAATGARFLSLTDQVLLVAIDAEAHVSYVSNLVGKDFTPDLPRRPTAAELESWAESGRYETTFFNANAFHYLAELPDAPARYHLFAFAGDIVSNVRTVEVRGEGHANPLRKLAPGAVEFGRSAQPPPTSPDFRGIALSARVPRWPAGGGPVWIDGVIQLPAQDAATLGASPLQKALVATVSSGLGYRTWNPAGERVLFPDDQETRAGLVRAPFSFELSQAFGPRDNEPVYVLVSAGPFLSNVLTLSPG